MNEVVLLSDNLVFGKLGSTRYMGPYVLASQLQSAGIKTQVVDYFTRHPDFFNYLRNFLSEETLILGISSTFLFPQKPSSFKHRNEGLDTYYTGELWFTEGKDLKKWLEDLRRVLNDCAPNCKIVLGGTKAQFAHWRRDFYEEIDYINLGPGDQSLGSLYNSLKSQIAPLTLDQWNSKILSHKDFLKRNAICPTCNYPDNFGIQHQESLPIEISRGCIYNCKFCHYEKKESFRKSTADLKQEFIRNYEMFGTTVYHFCDDCFNDSRKKVEDTCNMFLSLPFKIDWVAYARTDVAVKFPETLDLMIESGARGLYWGIESFDYQVALKAGKGTHPDLVKEMLLGFNKKYSARCMSEGSFIVGLPGETEENLSKTLLWLKENPVFDYATFGPLGLMPYTPDLDGFVFDFADYSRNPEKYGFTKVSFKPNYWEHETMNSRRADELAATISSAWREVKKPGIVRTIWLYPHLRSLGYSHEEIFAMRIQTENDPEKHLEIQKRFDAFINQYFNSLTSQDAGRKNYDLREVEFRT